MCLRFIIIAYDIARTAQGERDAIKKICDRTVFRRPSALQSLNRLIVLEHTGGIGALSAVAKV